jgi:predicted enzyme related to lactoylglutathione lyase
VNGPRHVLTILAVEDLPRAKEFYSRAFAWPQVVDVAIYAEFELPAGMRLGLYERDGFGRNAGQLPARTPAGEITATEIYLHVDDLESAIERGRIAGARELSPHTPRGWGAVEAYFADPDGNDLVLARPVASGAR